MNTRIAFDVDGVVLQSIDVILDYVNVKQGRNLQVNDLTGWDLEPIGLDMQTLIEAADFMYSQEFIHPYPGAVEVLEFIHEITGEPLLFITGRRRPETALRQLQQLPWKKTRPKMVVTGGDRDKRSYLQETSTAFIIEDDTKYLQDYLNAGIGVGLMIQPWNRHSLIPVTKRFHGWNDIDRWFKTLLRQECSGNYSTAIGCWEGVSLPT